MLHADGWPEIAAAQLEKGDVATAVACAIESNGFSAIIMAGLTLMLGTAGLEAHAVDAARIIRSGKLPLIVLLAERKGRSVATLSSRWR